MSETEHSAATDPAAANTGATPAPTQLEDWRSELGAAVQSGRLNPSTVAALQRSAGNRAVGRLLRRVAQSRATGSTAAVDATAAPTPTDGSGGPLLARAVADPAAARASLGTGSPLSGATRAPFERAFATDFSGVRIHNSPSDQAFVSGLGARAATVGSDIAFGPGEYAPGTPVGDALLAHELAHVVQQDGAMVARWHDVGAAEADADLAAAAAIAGGRARPRKRTGLALARCDGGSAQQVQQQAQAQVQQPAQAQVQQPAQPRVDAAAATTASSSTPTPLANPSDPLHPPWLTVLPWADEKTEVYAVYRPDLTVDLQYRERTAAGDKVSEKLGNKYALEGKEMPKPPPTPGTSGAAGTSQPAPPALTPEQQKAAADAAAKAQAAIDAICAAIDANRAKLPGWAFPKRPGYSTAGGAAWAGPAGYVRGTDDYTPPPVKQPAEKGKKPPPPKPVELTADQQSAIASAKAYESFYSHERTEIPEVARPAALGPSATQEERKPHDEAEKAWLNALESKIFYAANSLEGGTDSINVWDSQILTWGAGVGSATGQSSTIMYRLMTNPTVVEGKGIGNEVTRVLHEAGIALAPRYAVNKQGVAVATGTFSWAVVDTKRKQVFRDDDAAFLMKADPRLLMLLVHIARGELPGSSQAATLAPPAASGNAGGTAPVTSASAVPAETVTPFQDALRRAHWDASRDYFLHVYPVSTRFEGQITQMAKNGWPMEAIHLVVHLQWWGSGYVVDHGDQWPGFNALVKRVAATPTLSGKTNQIGNATVFPGDFGAHMVDYLLGKKDDVWEPPVASVDAAQTKAGDCYAEVATGWANGKPVYGYRKLKADATAATPGGGGGGQGQPAVTPATTQTVARAATPTAFQPTSAVARAPNRAVSRTTAAQPDLAGAARTRRAAARERTLSRAPAPPEGLTRDPGQVKINPIGAATAPLGFAEIADPKAKYAARRFTYTSVPTNLSLVWRWFDGSDREVGNSTQLTAELALDPGVIRDRIRAAGRTALGTWTIRLEKDRYYDEVSLDVKEERPLTGLEGETNQSWYNVRDLPGGTILGTLSGATVEITVDGKAKVADDVYYHVTLKSSTGTKADGTGAFPAGTKCWITGQAITPVMSWSVFRAELAAWEKANGSLSLAERITRLRQMSHKSNLPFDKVIGRSSGPSGTYLDQRPFKADDWDILVDSQMILMPDGKTVELQHLLVGLDVLTNKIENHSFREWGFKVEVGQNYSAATWAGDVGAGAADAAIKFDAEWERNNPKAGHADRVTRYYTTRLPRGELTGDIDAWGIDAARSAPGAPSTIEGLLLDYYGTAAVPDANFVGPGPPVHTPKRKDAAERFLRWYGFSYGGTASPLKSQSAPRDKMKQQIILFGKAWLEFRPGKVTDAITKEMEGFADDMVNALLDDIEDIAAQVGATP